MKIVSYSIDDTLKIAKILARSLGPGDIIGLSGQLGSGKTVFVKGLALALGIPLAKVISPTFVLIREHKGKIPLYHFDLYRLDNPLDIASLGYEEYFYTNGLSVVEWAERLGCLKPKDMLSIKISVLSSNKRRLEFKATSGHYKNILRSLHENIGN